MKRETEAKNDSGSFNVPIMTDSGKLRLDEFELGCAGIASRPGWGQWPKNDHVSASSANLQDDFVRIGVLGKGSSGVVYKALHIPTLTLVAQKVLCPSMLQRRLPCLPTLFRPGLASQVIPACDHHSLQKLSYELRALHSSLSQLGHQPRSDACPNIVAMHDAFVNPAEDSISIICELLLLDSALPYLSYVCPPPLTLVPVLRPQ
jgi:serine/threonine protein kinase